MKIEKGHYAWMWDTTEHSTTITQGEVLDIDQGRARVSYSSRQAGAYYDVIAWIPLELLWMS